MLGEPMLLILSSVLEKLLLLFFFPQTNKYHLNCKFLILNYGRVSERLCFDNW